MLVWRVETHDGAGPYWTGPLNRQEFPDCYDEHRCPPLYDDQECDTPAGQKHMNGGVRGWLFGFSSAEALMAWFLPHDREKLEKEHNCRVRVYRVHEVLPGAKQVIFKPAEVIAEVRLSGELEQLEFPFYEKVPEPTVEEHTIGGPDLPFDGVIWTGYGGGGSGGRDCDDHG